MQHMATIIELDGSVTVRPFTESEVEAHKDDQASWAIEAQAVLDKASADAAAQQAAIAHAKSLGFTDEMIAVMYPALIIP